MKTQWPQGFFTRSNNKKIPLISCYLKKASNSNFSKQIWTKFLSQSPINIFMLEVRPREQSLFSKNSPVWSAWKWVKMMASIGLSLITFLISTRASWAASWLSRVSINTQLWSPFSEKGNIGYEVFSEKVWNYIT